MTLTLKELEALNHKDIFAHGYRLGFGHWVAIRGGMPDWAVYATNDGKWDPRDIADHGNKVSKREALQLVVADPEATGMYRQ